MKQPMTKAQRLKNLFAKRMQRGPTSELPEENITPDVVAVDEQDAKPSAKDDQTLVYAELELKPTGGGEISFVNKPSPTVNNESTEYAEILYVQQQAGGTGTAGSETTPAQQPAQPAQQQRHHSSEDNRPVIDVSIQKPSAKGDAGSKGTGPGGK